MSDHCSDYCKDRNADIYHCVSHCFDDNEHGTCMNICSFSNKCSNVHNWGFESGLYISMSCGQCES
jgi:hypothetical protein